MPKINWPPKVAHGPLDQTSLGEKIRTSLNGEPAIIPLDRVSEMDHSARGYVINECCDCGLVHLYTYELLNMGGNYHLLKRPYRVKTGPKKSRPRKTRKK